MGAGEWRVPERRAEKAREELGRTAACDSDSTNQRDILQETLTSLDSWHLHWTPHLPPFLSTPLIPHHHHHRMHTDTLPLSPFFNINISVMSTNGSVCVGCVLARVCVRVCCCACHFGCSARLCFYPLWCTVGSTLIALTRENSPGEQQKTKIMYHLTLFSLSPSLSLSLSLCFAGTVTQSDTISHILSLSDDNERYNEIHMHLAEGISDTQTT